MCNRRRHFTLGALLAYVALGAQAIGAKELWFNEDDSHFYMMLRDEGKVSVTRERCARYVDDVCRGGAVTHFLMCPNAMRSNIDSKALEPIWKAFDEPGVNPRWAEQAVWIRDAGIDLYGEWIRACRERGVSPWLSVRMNDIHGVRDPTFPSLCTLWREHPELKRIPHYDGDDWHLHAFNFSNEVVRTSRLDYVKELLARYDVDGIEIDWMRFPYHLAPGRGPTDAHYLTELMREIRRVADDEGKRRDRRISVAARVTTTIASALDLGTDVRTWLKEKLVDVVIPCNFFMTSDFALPLREWQELIAVENPSVHLVSGTDIRVRKDEMDSQKMSVSEFAGWIDQQFSKGAPGVYLFNFYEFQHQKEPRTLWTTFMSRDGIDPVRVTSLSRTFPVTCRECAGPKTDGRQLPTGLREGADIVIDGGSGPSDDGIVRIRLAFAEPVVDSVLCGISLNGLSPMASRAVPVKDWIEAKEPTRAKCSYALEFPVKAARPGVNHLTFRPISGRENLLAACELEFESTDAKRVMRQSTP